MKITYWSDFACPYCYIGNTRLYRALEDLNIDADVEMKAFELDMAASRIVESDTVTRFSKKYGISLEDARKQVESISELGRSEGLDFNYGSTLYTNTVDAHRLMKFACDKYPDLADSLSDALFEAYFSKNLKLADRDTLVDIASSVGMDKGDVGVVLDGDNYLYDVRSDEDDAYAKGVFAVPYYIIGDYLAIPGALAYDDFKGVLEDLSLEGKDSDYCSLGGCK